MAPSGCHSRNHNAPDVSPCHSGSGPIRIAFSALLELADWIEARRTSVQGGLPCNTDSAPPSPPTPPQAEPIVSRPGGPPVPAPATQSPGYPPRLGPHPDPDRARPPPAGAREGGHERT